MDNGYPYIATYPAQIFVFKKRMEKGYGYHNKGMSQTTKYSFIVIVKSNLKLSNILQNTSTK